ncbi:hypothetical protein [Flavobacterium johnsoniae]|uniref:Uncharacterized protein n=1 Tax=Flavobacterium johnsoniae TaxID=986 RepID=A0A1J7CUJ3_FLAJO|nr:hypothetical protein [Flavobacterium johnsoniae]OIV43290.1 hypothetical protein BKM63_03515 [Flavobacterium johnsoniae]
MENLISNAATRIFTKCISDDSVENQTYAEYMSNIILQLPNSEKLQFLTGTSSGQASFYFMNNAGQLNASLYNNFLNQRISGEGSQYGVRQVSLTSDSFINSYLSVYLKLRYQLSPKDNAEQERISKNVSSTVSELIPLWNAYVTEYQPEKISKLNETNTDIALIQVTDALNTVWINLEYILKLKEEPSYPYTHINDFYIIYSEIPEEGVSIKMKELMKSIYELSGAAGAVTAEIANAVHTLAIIIYNLIYPSNTNKAISVTGTDQLIPGLLFEPSDADDIVNQLSRIPVVSYTNHNNVDRLSSELLKINIINSKEITISPLKFLSNTLAGGTINSVFKETFSGTSYVVEAIVNNPVVNPQMMVSPVPFDIMTNTGWMLSEPIKQAVKNKYPPPTNITGYVFNSEPNFNFSEGGDFGFINSMVFSQFLELYITFTDCNVGKVKKYFENNKSSRFNFLGQSIGNPAEALSYSYQVKNENSNSVTVVIKPKPPGFIPPTSDITESSSQITAVEVVYPFA